MHTLPEPLAGEVLYSALARAAIRRRCCSRKRSLDLAYRGPDLGMLRPPVWLACVGGAAQDRRQFCVEGSAGRCALDAQNRGSGVARRGSLAMPASSGSLQVGQCPEKD